HGNTDATRTTCVVVVETRHRGDTIVVGLIADSVSEVLDLTAGQIEPPPAFGTNVRVDFLAGMGKLEGRLILVLDIDCILSPAEVEETANVAVPAAETATTVVSIAV